MASKKSKFSPWNDSDKVLDRMVDTTREMPKAKKGLSVPANSDTFSAKGFVAKNGKKKKK